MAKKSKNILNKTVDSNKEITIPRNIKLHGFLLGTILGGVVGLILSFIFKTDLGWSYGIFPGMVIGFIIDVNNAKKNNSNNKSKKKK